MVLLPIFMGERAHLLGGMHAPTHVLKQSMSSSSPCQLLEDMGARLKHQMAHQVFCSVSLAQRHMSGQRLKYRECVQ